jgi:23S rRNA pseudouridine1911/1915/1917 synthase
MADDSFFELHPRREETNERLDKFVATRLADLGLSRSYVQGLIEAGHVLVDGVARRAKFKMTPGEVVEVTLPPPAIEALEPEPIPLAIVYEDADLIVLDKPAGLVVHPAPGHLSGTLVNALLHHAPGINVGGSNRPGIVHRLDKDTSGLMVVAKTDRARTTLVAQWEAVGKGYLALVHGVVEPDEGTVDAPIGRDPVHRQRMAVAPRGRPAVTHFAARRRYGTTTLLDLELETGRTHQIRVHLAFIRHPIVGDPVYGRRAETGFALDRQFLHAARLAFAHPATQAPVDLASPLPPDLAEALETAR